MSRNGKPRQRSASGAEAELRDEEKVWEKEKAARRTVFGKIKNRLHRQRSTSGDRALGSPSHMLTKSSTLPARMTPDSIAYSSPHRAHNYLQEVDERYNIHHVSDEESGDSGLDPRDGDGSGSDSSPRNQKMSSIYDEVAVQRAFGPAMKDIGRYFSQQIIQPAIQPLPCNYSEEDRLGSRPPPPLPNSVVAKKPSQDSVLADLDADTYDRIQPRLLGTNGLQLGLRDLAHHGWYWGPLTRVEAEEKLTNCSDGTFLVRDSSDDRYLLSLSFRSQGKTLHTRIEYCNGHFSFYSFPDSENEGYRSVVELIDRSMKYSSVGVFCFSRARATGSPAVPVRLLKPLSRLTQMRSLQHYCRFVIRQSIRYDSIRQLPLPRHVHSFLEMSHIKDC